MSRRRPSFRTYVRRRWRALGLVAVLLCGAFLVLAATDRGHDPTWEARGAVVDQAVLSPSGDMAYALIRDGENLSRLEARRGSDGELLWESPITTARALLRAGDEGVAVATDFPSAFLTFYGRNGTARFQIPLEGNPRAMAVGTDQLALALQAPENPVLVIRDGRVERVHRFDGFVNSLDLRGGFLAVGTGEGEIAVYTSNGTTALDYALPLNVKSLRLSADGGRLLAGGYNLTAGDLSGALAFLDVGNPAPLRWALPTHAGVGLVSLDAAGILALAVEESPPRHLVRLIDAGTGSERWSRTMEGLVSRDDAGAFGGAAISPDASYAIVATLGGPVEAYDAVRGNVVWRFDSSGTTVLAFSPDAPDRFVANAELVQNGPYDSLLMFSTRAEPTLDRLGAAAALSTVLAALAASAIVGVGYWRVRRSY